MLDYVFFNEQPLILFTQFIEARGVPVTTTFTGENFEVAIPEDLEDELDDKIEDYYDELSEMDRQLLDGVEGESKDNYQMASIICHLSDGGISYADVTPKLLARIMESVAPEEFGEIVTAIVRAVENPDERTFCQRVRDGDVLITSENG